VRIRLILAAAAIVMIAGVGNLFAGPIIIDFAGGFPGGTVNYSLSGGPLVGTGISIIAVQGINTPNNASFHSITGGALSFSTGNLVSYSSGIYTFGSGGFLTISGGIPDAGIANSTALLTAPVTSGKFNSTGCLELTILGGLDTKNPEMLAYFGMAGLTSWAFSGTVHTYLTSGDGNGGLFTSTANGNTNIANLYVPEPSLPLLLALGVLGVGFLTRRLNL
jgi:hypothetical protein